MITEAGIDVMSLYPDLTNRFMEISGRGFPEAVMMNDDFPVVRNYCNNSDSGESNSQSDNRYYPVME